MPRYTRKEFCDLCDITQAYLSVNIKRKKVVLNENGEVDTSLDINAAWAKKRIEKAKKKALTVSEPPETVPEIKPGPTKKTKKKEVSADLGMEEAQTVATYDLERIKKQLEIEEKETSIAINKIKLDKLNGVVIPTDLVMVIFGQHSKSITTAFHQAAENYIVEMAATYEIDKKGIASMRGKLIDIVNQAVKESLEDSRKHIDNIVDEYAINGK